MKSHIFHSRFLNDLRKTLEYYEDKAGPKLADRFFQEVETQSKNIIVHPERFHLDQSGLRRCNLPNFPFHILFFETDTQIAIQVLKHDHRHPSFGTRRKF